MYPFEFIERHGLWIESGDDKKFYYGIDLVEFLLGMLNSKPTEAIEKVYSKIELVSANVAKHQKIDANGLLIKTEMEKFKCVQCGHCCLNLSDAYQTSVPDFTQNLHLTIPDYLNLSCREAILDHQRCLGKRMGW